MNPSASVALKDDLNPIKPSSALSKQILAETGINLSVCYQCKKCSNGCPVTSFMDYKPYEVVRLAQFGLTDKLKNADTIWVCASCHTCLTRCPNEIDIPRLMDWLKEKVAKEKRPIKQRKTKVFHQEFLDQVRKRGRIFEGEMMALYMLKTGGAFGAEAIKNGFFGLAMLKRGRLGLLPHRIKDRKWLKALFK